MHPAYSVILFTTTSGAGYGLLFWLGLRAVVPPGVPGGWPDLVALGLGLALVTVGLLSSTFHLGRPERAWRAFSQWRSSWLSREGVAAVATYVPAGLLGLSLLWPGAVPGRALLGALLVLGAVATVWCTGMIYACLRTVPAWNMRRVPVLYLLLSAGTGGLILTLIDAAAGRDPRALAALSAAALAAALAVKLSYWRRIDGRRGAAGPRGADRRGQVRLDVPRAGADDPGAQVVTIADLDPTGRARPAAPWAGTQAASPRPASPTTAPPPRPAPRW
jgi:sulfite dehydrogenase (quinone) subunit SoeC